MGDKIRTFCSKKVGLGKIAGSEDGAPRAWRFFFKKITHFKHCFYSNFCL